MLKNVDLQLLAEGDEAGAPDNSAASKPEGKVWTDEYVKGLREEAKANRIQAKNYRLQLAKLLGLKDEDDVDDSKITAFQEKSQKEREALIQKANARLLAAEIKALDGYNAKLVDRLLDKSKVTVEEDGTIKGLKEAVEELAKEFPEVKIVAAGSGGVNPPPKNSELETLKQKLEKATTLEEKMKLRTKIHELTQTN